MDYVAADIRRPLRLVTAGRFASGRAWTHARRVMDSFEVIFGIRGRLFLREEEQRFEVGEGDVLVLMPGRVHEGFAPSPEGTAFYWVHFAQESGCSILGEDGAGSGGFPDMDGMHTRVLLPQYSHPARPERIELLVRQVLDLHESGCYTGLASGYALTSLLIELTEQALDRPAAPDREGIAEIIQWIDTQISRPVSLREAAQRFSYTREYLARFFRRHMGMPMQQYVHIRKMARARELLGRTDDLVREVAVAVGFRDEKYFMRLFKRYEGMTPKEYRSAYQRMFRNGVGPEAVSGTGIRR